MTDFEFSLKSLIRAVSDELIASQAERVAGGLPALFEVQEFNIEVSFVVTEILQNDSQPALELRSDFEFPVEPSSRPCSRPRPAATSRSACSPDGRAPRRRAPLSGPGRCRTRKCDQPRALVRRSVRRRHPAACNTEATTDPEET